MGNLGLLLASMVPTLVRKVLAALGFGIVTITGLTVVTDALKQNIINTFGGIPGDILAVANLAGMGTAINILLGALSARVALYVLLKSSRIIGG